MLFIDTCEQGSAVAIGSGGGKDDRQGSVNWLLVTGTRSIYKAFYRYFMDFVSFLATIRVDHLPLVAQCKRSRAS